MSFDVPQPVPQSSQERKQNMTTFAPNQQEGSEMINESANKSDQQLDLTASISTLNTLFDKDVKSVSIDQFAAQSKASVASSFIQMLQVHRKPNEFKLTQEKPADKWFIG